MSHRDVGLYGCDGMRGGACLLPRSLPWQNGRDENASDLGPYVPCLSRDHDALVLGRACGALARSRRRGHGISHSYSSFGQHFRRRDRYHRRPQLDRLLRAHRLLVILTCAFCVCALCYDRGGSAKNDACPYHACDALRSRPNRCVIDGHVALLGRRTHHLLHHRTSEMCGDGDDVRVFFLLIQYQTRHRSVALYGGADGGRSSVSGSQSENRPVFWTLIEGVLALGFKGC